MILRFISCFLVIVVFTTVPFNGFAEKRLMNIGINSQDNFPSMGKPGTENSKNPGILIEEMRYIAKQADLKIRYIRVPWKRCLKMLKAGEMDALICGSYKKEREIYGVFPTINGKPDPSRRFSDSSYYLYIRKGSGIKWNGKKFNKPDIRVGAELGFSIVPLLKKLGVKVEEVSSVRVNFKKLLMDRLDAVAAHESSGDVIKLYRPDIVKIKPPLKSKPYYLMMSHQLNRSDPKLVKKVWGACKELQKKEVQRIKAKYRGKKHWGEM